MTHLYLKYITRSDAFEKDALSPKTNAKIKIKTEMK